MYQLTTQPTKSKIKHNEAYEGERIEEKIDRIVNNNEPISDGAPIIYTERKDGVLPEYDIRADKWDIAIDAMDKVAESNKMKRDIAAGERMYDKMTDEKKAEFNKKYPQNKHNIVGKPEPTQGNNE